MQYGTGEHAHELVGDWAMLPDGESFLDVGSVRVTGNDDVLVLNRGSHPVMAFDEHGERLATWENGHFSDRPHGMGLARHE